MVLVFAHVPPPFHGQSYMVKLMLDGLRGAGANGAPLKIYHVNARFSSDTSDIGSAGMAKVWRAIWYSFHAIAIRVRHKTDILYYVPAPAKRAALYRDWIVMALCRPFVRKVVFHWHAVGLGEWLDGKATPLERFLSHLLLGRAELSVVLSDFACTDAAVLRPKRIVTIPNGIPDPCPGLKPRDSKPRDSFTILFLAACTAEKGLFAAIDAAELLQRRFGQVEVRLMIAGEFTNDTERAQFKQRLSTLAGVKVDHAGFLNVEQKSQLLSQVDCLVFPSTYPHEGQPVAIIEALAYDLPVVAARWRGIPEMLAGTTSFLVDNQSPGELASALEQAFSARPNGTNRRHFLEQFEVSGFVRRLTAELTSLC